METQASSSEIHTHHQMLWNTAWLSENIEQENHKALFQVPGSISYLSEPVFQFLKPVTYVAHLTPETMLIPSRYRRVTQSQFHSLSIWHATCRSSMAWRGPRKLSVRMSKRVIGDASPSSDLSENPRRKTRFLKFLRTLQKIKATNIFHEEF